MSALKGLFQSLAHAAGFHVERTRAGDPYPVLRPMDRDGVEVLADRAFQESCRSVAGLTLLDTPRLANLWSLCRLTDPSGAILEVGSFRGGGALHLSNCCPDREILVCDPFDETSFQHLEADVDRRFERGQFAGVSQRDVEAILDGRKATVTKGYFPEAMAHGELPRISFVHLDVDVYVATKRSLLFLLRSAPLCARSLIVLDDYARSATGVDQAVDEVLHEVPDALRFPMFPGQAIIIPDSGSGFASANVR